MDLKQNTNQRKAKYSYYNGHIINTNSQVGSYQYADFMESRSSDILEKSSEYAFSIVRFNCPASSIPVSMAVIEGFPNTDPNKTVYTVSLRYGAFVATHHIIFVPTDKTQTVPSAPAITETGRIRVNYYKYYSIYTVSHFISMINTALAGAYADLLVLIAPTTLPNDCAPVFQLMNNGQVSLTVSRQSYLGVTPAVQLYMNYELASNFLGGFTLLSNPPSSGDLQFLFYLNDYTYVNIPTRLSPFNVASVTINSEISIVDNFVTIQSIVFVSNLMSVKPELQTAINPNSFEYSQSDTSASINTISDILIPRNSNTGLEWRESLQYIPQTIRYSSFYTDNSLRTIQISAYYRDNFSNLFKIEIPYGRNASIKLMFEKL
jgi:hypothetical protein